MTVVVHVIRPKRFINKYSSYKYEWQRGIKARDIENIHNTLYYAEYINKEHLVWVCKK
jgi:hypothetical protein